MPGTYTESTTTVVVSKLNVRIVAFGDVTGNTFLNFILNVNNASSTVGLFGLNIANLTISGAGNCYAKGCSVTTSLTKSGSGYFEAVNCSFDGSAVNTVNGTGSCVFDSGKVGALIVSNAAAFVSVKDAISGVALTATAGLLDISNSTIYSISDTANAVTPSNGTTLNISNSRFVTPTGVQARLSVAGNYAFSDVSYDFINTTFAGTALNLDNESFFNKLRVDGGVRMQWLSIAYNSTFKKAYPSGSIVYNSGSFYISNANIPVGTAFTEGVTGATWTKIGGSGGSSSANVIKKTIAAIADGSLYNVSPNDGDEFVLTNIANLNNNWGTIVGLQENDIVIYNATDNNYSISLAVSAITKKGDYQVYNNDNKSIYYYDSGWRRINDNYEVYTLSGDAIKHYLHLR